MLKTKMQMTVMQNLSRMQMQIKFAHPTWLLGWVRLLLLQKVSVCFYNNCYLWKTRKCLRIINFEVQRLLLNCRTMATYIIVEIYMRGKLTGIVAKKACAIKMSLYRYRRSNYQFQDPISLADILIPDLLQRTYTNERFMQYDSEDKRRILIYTKNENIRVSFIR